MESTVNPVPTGSALGSACPWLRESLALSRRPQPSPSPELAHNHCFCLAVLCIPTDLAPRLPFLGKECSEASWGSCMGRGLSCVFLGRVGRQTFHLSLPSTSTGLGHIGPGTADECHAGGLGVAGRLEARPVEGWS